MKKMHLYSFFMLLCVSFTPSQLWSWDRHDLLTELAFEKVEWLNTYNSIRVTSFESAIKKIFSKSFTKDDFAKQYQLNPKRFKLRFLDPKGRIKTKFGQPGDTTSAKLILAQYADEPDHGMDQELNMYSYQKWMGGTKGPTSRAFRHMYFKRWSITAPLRTFHVPPIEMGEALKRAQIFYNLAEMAFKKSEPYWAFRFLAWSLHYIQDVGQPFHSNQLLTPKFVSFKDFFNFNKFVQRTTQINANYHWMYEAYMAHRLVRELEGQGNPLFTSAIRGTDIRHSSSALLLTKHISDISNRFAYDIGEACFIFFGKKFLSPDVDVPQNPAAFPVSHYDKNSTLSKKRKKHFLKATAKNLKNTGLYTRSLLALAKREFLKK